MIKLKIFSSPKQLCFDKTALALGNFDGVHIAHQKVIGDCVALAKKNGAKSGVMLFKNAVKPADVISSLEERIELIGALGVDFIILCEFDEAFRRQSPAEFVAFLTEELKAAAVSVGYDYRFGYLAEGDVDVLKSLARESGMEVSVCAPYKKDGVTISSTQIRKMLKEGDIEGVNAFLGRRYSVSGIVCHGLKNGRRLGFKTANLKCETSRILPCDGVYAGKTYLNGKPYISVINIGKNPTFAAKERTVESHMIGFEEEIYGAYIRIEFKRFLRGEKKFGGIEELKNQINQDRERARREMKEFQCVILAAGMGTRMKSETPKVLHKICGKSLIEWVLQAAKGAGADRSCVIVGHKAEAVQAVLGESCQFALQAEQKGTGHAVMQAADFIRDGGGTVVILCGDAPLVSADMLRSAIAAHDAGGCSATVITAVLEDASGYGRIVRNSDGSVKKIVEHKDATEEERKIGEVNTGMFVFESGALLEALSELTPANAQNEYYLTDTLEILAGKGKRIGGYVMDNADEARGINDRVQLSQAEKIMQERINAGHMRNGVTMILPETIIIEDNVEIGCDTILYPNVIIKAGTKIGTHCVIGSGTQITGSEIGDHVEITSSVLLECSIGDGTTVGPFAYVRPNTRVGKSVRVGDFVELKNSNIDDGTKISHLTYVGDADVGKRVNFGCGTVTVNYDGKKKYRTKIGDDCFIGCNTNLVAPVVVENGGYTAAGSTITDSVPEQALAIARARQVNKENWKDRRK